MTAPSPPVDSETTKNALRVAACLAAQGYSPHEVHYIVATDLVLDQCVVAGMLRRHAIGPSRTAA